MIEKNSRKKKILHKVLRKEQLEKKEFFEHLEAATKLLYFEMLKLEFRRETPSLLEKNDEQMSSRTRRTRRKEVSLDVFRDMLEFETNVYFLESLKLQLRHERPQKASEKDS